MLAIKASGYNSSAQLETINVYNLLSHEYISVSYYGSPEEKKKEKKKKFLCENTQKGLWIILVN